MIVAKPKWVVVEAAPRKDFSIELRFADGKRGLFDMSPLLKEDYYRALSVPAVFMTAHAECGTVVWDNDMDVAPELLYERCGEVAAKGV